MHDPQHLKSLLIDLHNHLRDQVYDSRNRDKTKAMAEVASISQADIIYGIDALSETIILEWFAQHWPSTDPVELIMEGLDSECIFPRDANGSQLRYRCIIDPIDGTRNLMHDKRSAWILTGLAPVSKKSPQLQDIEIAVMTELPPSKQTRSDQLSIIKGEPLAAIAFDLTSRKSSPLNIHPTDRTDCRHGFASIVKFFPEGLSLTAQLEEYLWHSLYPESNDSSPLVFTDQYISTGGQLYELLVGHDCFIADLRPLIFKKLNIESSLACHPYDLATLLLATGSGIIVEDPLTHQPVNPPLDTTTPVAWVAYANSTLAQHIRPHLSKAIDKFLKEE